MIFIDFDGSLKEWNEHAGPDIWMQAKYVWSCIDMPNMVEAVKILIKKGLEVRFLSATVSPAASIEKKACLKKMFEGVELKEYMFIFTPYGQSKTDFVNPRGNILLDDYSINCMEWEQAGGRAIKVRNNCNGKNGKWRGISVSYKQTPESIAELITALAITTDIKGGVA